MNNKRLIILGSVVPDYGGTTVGGIATHVTQLAENMKEHYSELIVIHSGKKDSKFENVKFLGVKKKSRYIYFLLKGLCCSFPKKRSALKAHAYKAMIKSIIGEYCSKKDVIHVHSIHHPFLDILQELGYDVIITDHGFWQKEYSEDLLNKRLEYAQSIICVSKYAKEKLDRTFPNIKEKSRVIYNPIEINETAKCCNNKSEYTVLFNGYSESVKRKGADLFINVAKLNPNSNFVAIMDQEGWSYADKILVPNLKPYGKISYKEIVNLYLESDLMILPSRSESFGLVYLEAASFGVPVIGKFELISEFNNYLGIEIGLGFDAEKEGEVQLDRLINQAKSKNWKPDDMRKAVKEKFSWSTKKREFIKIYEHKH